jgi:hypothetical protein
MKLKHDENIYILLKLLNNFDRNNSNFEFGNSNNLNNTKISHNIYENIDLNKLKFENCFIIDKKDLLKDNFKYSNNSDIDKKYLIEKENEKVYLKELDSISNKQRNEKFNTVKNNDNIDIFEDQNLEEKLSEILSLNCMIIDELFIKQNSIELTIKKEKPPINSMMENMNFINKNSEENFKFSELKIYRNSEKNIDIDIICEDLSDSYFLNYVFQLIQ